MTDLYQKKFYIDSMTEAIVNQYAKDNGMGFSEALRAIVKEWTKSQLVKVPIIGSIKNGKVNISSVR